MMIITIQSPTPQALNLAIPGHTKFIDNVVENLEHIGSAKWQAVTMFFFFGFAQFLLKTMYNEVHTRQPILPDPKLQGSLLDGTFEPQILDPKIPQCHAQHDALSPD